MYLLKTPNYENILWRVETQVNNIADKMDTYHLVNILRAFSHSQINKTFGKDQTYYNLEPMILKNLDKINDRDFTHLLYAYGVRNVGNPELHKAFESRIEKLVNTSSLDYPSLYNVVYYLLFKENANKKLWQKVI